MEQEKIFKRVLSVLASIALLYGLIASVSGSRASAQLFGEESLGKNMAEVSGKAPNCVIITNHRFEIASNYLMVTPFSSIIDIDGKKISLKDLKIPCVAEIRFRKNRKNIDPELVRLKVKEYAKRTSSRFTMKKPFVRYPE